MEDPSSNGPAVYNLECYQEELAAFGLRDVIPEWRAMAKSMPELLAKE
jgi:hypothetical protein